MKPRLAHRICTLLVAVAMLASVPIQVMSVALAGNQMALCDSDQMPTPDCCIECRDEGTAREACAGLCATVIAVLLEDVGSSEYSCTMCPNGLRSGGAGWSPRIDPYPPRPTL